MKVRIVVPCFNEGGRLDDANFGALFADPDVGVVCVDDGSTDDTWSRLEAIAARHPGRVELLRMPGNVGKGESVRRGMRHAAELGAAISGFTDADFSTPSVEMLRLVKEIQKNDTTKALFGSRWLHLGTDIRRSALRHYTGRVFATFASMVLEMPVYDTQCGAKLFRVTETLIAALDEPFLSRWAFDVELIGRLREGSKDAPGYALEAFVEVPLQIWADVRGSKIGLPDMIGATLDLIPIYRELRRLRHAGRTPR